MTKYFRKGRSVSAVVRDDGTVYFNERASKPVSVQLLDWTLTGLWLLAGVVLIALIF